MKIHCSSLEPQKPTNTLRSTSSIPLNSKGQKSTSRVEEDENHHHQDSEEVIMESQEPQLTKLECVHPHHHEVRNHHDHHDDLCSILDSDPQLSSMTPHLSSVQMSPAGSTDMALYPRGPLSDVTDPVSYYTMSPPDLLSPPLSTSDPCLSPGSSLSPALSPPHTCPETGSLFPLKPVSGPCASSLSPTQSFATSDNDHHNHKSESMKQKTEQSDNCQTDIVMTASSRHNHMTTSASDNNNENLNNHEDSGEEQLSSFLSSSSSTCINQQGTSCVNCSPKNCSCNKQSKLKQLFNPQPQQLSSFDSKQSVTSFHQDENFMKLIENRADKKAKESMKTEPQELISNAAIISSDSVTTQAATVQNRFSISGETGVRSTCALPSDIPTLESLSRTSPKLSTWRQTRIISEKLEQHLWTWRCACKKSGKRISKSLLQARAKWAFRKAGIVEFKV